MPNSKGWIKLNRSILDWEHFDDPKLLKMFIWLLLNANVSEGEFMGVKIPRGSLATSRRKLAKHLKMTEGEVISAISSMSASGEISTFPHRSFTVVALANYDKYQSKISTKISETPSANSTQSKNSIKNTKEKRKYKEKIADSAIALTASPPAQEEEFYREEARW